MMLPTMVKSRSGKLLLPLAGLIAFVASILAIRVQFVPLRTNALFSENMVLQQGVPVPVWGTTTRPNEVTVLIQDQRVSAVPKDGKWRVTLEPLKPGGPYTLTILQRMDRIERKNVMVGDVWLCGGQSNMVWTVAQSDAARETTAAARNEKLRLFQVPRGGSAEPKTKPPS